MFIVEYILRDWGDDEMKKFELSKIGLGTWLLGGDVNENVNNDDVKDINAIRYAIINGINHIDTSESYSGGKSEKLVGEAIKVFDRKKVFIATKVREWNLSYDNIIKSCLKSLERLQTNYIDLYYIHKQNKEYKIKDICQALNYLLQKGLIKNVGLSNVGIETIKEYNIYLSKKVFAVQNQYNLICRESQKKGIIKYCRQNNIKFVCWRPLLLSYPNCKDPMYRNETYPILDKVAKKYSVSNIQIAAKWLLYQDNIYIIFKSNNCDHIKEILDTKKIKLSDEDWKDLNENFPIMFDVGCSTNEFYEVE